MQQASLTRPHSTRSPIPFQSPVLVTRLGTRLVTTANLAEFSQLVHPGLRLPWARLTHPPSPLVQGATVLHCLARLYEIEVQGATQGATKCYIRCYTFHIATRKPKSTKTAKKLGDWLVTTRQPANPGASRLQLV